MQLGYIRTPISKPKRLLKSLDVVTIYIFKLFSGLNNSNRPNNVYKTKVSRPKMINRPKPIIGPNLIKYEQTSG